MSRALQASAHLFTCPVCQAPFEGLDKRFVCPKGHSFDMAKQGYINLLLHSKKDKHYDKASFERRHHILEAGFYKHILEVIQTLLADNPAQTTLLDVACGEGYYSRQLAHNPRHSILAFDLSKESIQLAAKKDSHQRVAWFVGDLAKLPLASQSVDVILDIYSPSNYQEFKRVLKPGGKLIKVVTASHHLAELRQAAQAQLANKTYSNQAIRDHFSQAFPQFKHIHTSQTYPANPEELLTFAQMTPLFFHVNLEQLDWQSLHEITIAADIFVATIPKTTTS